MANRFYIIKKHADGKYYPTGVVYDLFTEDVGEHTFASIDMFLYKSREPMFSYSKVNSREEIPEVIAEPLTEEQVAECIAVKKGFEIEADNHEGIVSYSAMLKAGKGA